MRIGHEKHFIEGITPEVTPEDTPEVTHEVSASALTRVEVACANPRFKETRHGSELTLSLPPEESSLPPSQAQVEAQEVQVAEEHVTEQVAVHVTVQVLPQFRYRVVKRSRNTIFVMSRKWSPSKRTAGEVRGEATGEVGGDVIALQKARKPLQLLLSLFVFFVAIICTSHATSYGTSRATSQQTGFRGQEVMKNGHKNHKKKQKGYALTISANLVTKTFEREGSHG